MVIIGLKSMFRKDRDQIEIVDSAPDVKKAIAEFREGEFDIIMLDLWIGDSKPPDNLKMLKEAFPFKPIVILSYEDSIVWQHKMYKAGASGYLLKTSRKSELRSYLEKIANTQIIFPHLFDENRQEHNQNPALNSFFEKLTSHQHDIVSLMSEGNTMSEIGEKLNISVSTIEKILAEVRKKFQAKTNSHLVSLLTHKKIL